MTNTYQPTAHANLLRHLERHQYTRGECKGDAPADPSRRGKSHFRVRKQGATMAVRFHNTDILTAHEDGTIVLNCAGWDTAPTTREAMSYALKAAGLHGRMRTKNLGGYVNTVLSVQGCGTYVYHDGLTLDSQGRLVTNPRPLIKRIKDKDQTKEFREASAEFRAVLPVLHSACAPAGGVRRGAGLDFVVGMIQNPEHWPDLVYAFYQPTAQETWRAIYADATRDMTTTIEVQP